MEIAAELAKRIRTLGAAWRWSEPHLRRRSAWLAEAFNSLGIVFSLFAIPLFFVNAMIYFILDGGALNAPTADGRYFLTNHGDVTEVSWLVYTLSWYLEVLMIGTFVPMALCLGLSDLLGKYGQKPTPLDF